MNLVLKEGDGRTGLALMSLHGLCFYLFMMEVLSVGWTSKALESSFFKSISLCLLISASVKFPTKLSWNHMFSVVRAKKLN